MVYQVILTAVDPNNGLIELPENVTDAADRISAGCPTDEEARFVATGRGGIPANPRQTLREEIVLQDLRDTVTSNQLSVTSTRTINNDKTIVEATGWIVNKDGVIEFIANSNRIQQTSKKCHAVKQFIL